jgi:hypothetical protein
MSAARDDLAAIVRDTQRKARQKGGPEERMKAAGGTTHQVPPRGAPENSAAAPPGLPDIECIRLNPVGGPRIKPRQWAYGFCCSAAPR